MRLFGRNSVIERLRANPQSIRKLFLQMNYEGKSYVQKKAKKWNIPLQLISEQKMMKAAQNKNTQGILADVADYEFENYKDFLQTALKQKRCPVFLDGLQDPQNLGSLIRSLACLGKFSIVIPTHKSVGVTEAVLRVASGGDNYVPISKVANVNVAIKQAKAAGFWIAGAVVDGGAAIEETKLPLPIGLVIGSEQKGIKTVVRKNLDLEISISMPVSTLSFNAAHATAIFCYEITRQKVIHKKNKEQIKSGD